MTSVGAMIRRDIPPGQVPGHARLIQQGFDELWVVEDLPFAGGISQLTAVLAATEDVVVGHGIAPAPFRNSAALAMEWATLAELFPGRLATGIGHGVQSWMDQIGARVPSPLALLGEVLTAVRRLLAGETVTVDGRYVHLEDVALRFPPARAPLVSAGVTGPKSLELSGEIADGTILGEGQGPDQLELARESIERGRSKAGPGRAHRLTVFAGFYAGDPAGLGEPNPDALSGWEAVAPEPIEVAAKLQTLIDAGADALILVPFGRDATEQLQLAAAEIVPRLVV